LQLLALLLPADGRRHELRGRRCQCVSARAGSCVGMKIYDPNVWLSLAMVLHDHEVVRPASTFHNMKTGREYPLGTGYDLFFRIRIRIILYSRRIRVISGYCSFGFGSDTECSFGFGSDTERELPRKYLISGSDTGTRNSGTRFFFFCII
jgi:hypothetical protein